MSIVIKYDAPGGSSANLNNACSGTQISAFYSSALY
jgi:hypothetical protein